MLVSFGNTVHTNEDIETYKTGDSMTPLVIRREGRLAAARWIVGRRFVEENYGGSLSLGVRGVLALSPCLVRHGHVEFASVGYSTRRLLLVETLFGGVGLTIAFGSDVAVQWQLIVSYGVSGDRPINRPMMAAVRAAQRMDTGHGVTTSAANQGLCCPFERW